MSGPVAVLAWLSTCVVAAVLGWSVALSAIRVRRLDRLHVRVDAARAGLLAALDRRASVAGEVASVASVATSVAASAWAAPRVADGPAPGGLVGAVAAATAAGTDWPDREAAENRLGRLLAGVDRSAVPTPLRTELDDAEQLLLLARRVHNDAVRDTLGLRSRRLVRWLRLAGTAPLPRYFEIADPDTGVTSAAPVAADWT